MTTYKVYGDLNPDGTLFGQTAADKIGFHGATPCDQSTVAATVVATAVLISTGKAGFVSTTGAKSIVTSLNLVLTCLKEKGLMATS